MNHESGVKLAFPMDDAVVCAGTNKGVEHHVLIGLMGDMPEGAVHTATGGYGDLRHGAELGRLDELREVGCPCHLIC